jgi:putative phosphoesterase
LDELSGVDIIVHAGDYVRKPLLDELRKLGNFVGVHGNMDSADVKSELPAKCVFDAMDFKVGLAHPAEGGASFHPRERIKATFEYVDIVIYGHTHMARNEVVNGILCFNPGSATGVFPASYKSIGIITINERIHGKIIKL